MILPQFSLIESTIKDSHTLAATLAQWRSEGAIIVFTNGCFDLLHYGHLHYLAQARNLGDRLVVGLNSAASVRRLKGPRRPINDELTRMYTLASLRVVDAVVVFEEDTPLRLIEEVQPDVLVKGGDWQPHQIVGSDFVLARGGAVRSLPFVEGYSTTNIEAKIVKDFLEASKH
jgi:D-glycero-beta-D-manno-heptose 1-phosphate adenylyltransferase